MAYIGIDVAKDKSYCFIMNTEGEIPTDVFGMTLTIFTGRISIGF